MFSETAVEECCPSCSRIFVTIEQYAPYSKSDLLIDVTAQVLTSSFLFQLRQGLAAVLQQLIGYEQLRVRWLANYSVQDKWLCKTLEGTK